MKNFRPILSALALALAAAGCGQAQTNAVTSAPSAAQPTVPQSMKPAITKTEAFGVWPRCAEPKGHGGPHATTWGHTWKASS